MYTATAAQMHNNTTAQTTKPIVKLESSCCWSSVLAPVALWELLSDEELSSSDSMHFAEVPALLHVLLFPAAYVHSEDTPVHSHEAAAVQSHFAFSPLQIQFLPESHVHADLMPEQY
jgi:hypothetical protein